MAQRDTHSKTVAVVLTVILLAWVLAGLAVRIWSSEQAYRISGPTHVAAGQGRVFLYTAGEIHALSGDGKWLGATSLADVGFSDDPIDMRVLDDGRLLIAGQRPAAVRLCDMSNLSCERLAPGQFARIDRQFKIHPLAAGDGWLLTDAAGDQLWTLDSETGDLEPAVPTRTLAGPNGIALDSQGVPWVADTDHRRLVELLQLPNGGYVTGREHSAHNSLTIAQRHYPMMLEWGADERFWVVQASSFSEARADVVVYDRDEGAVDVITMPDDAYPTDLAVIGRNAVVTDMDRFRVYRIDTRSGAVSEFGDAAFSERLLAHSARRNSLERLGTLSLVVVIIGALALITAAIRMTPPDKRWSSAAPALDVQGAAPFDRPLKGVHWLKQNPKSRWLTHGFERLYYLLFGLLCLCAYLLYAWSCGQPLRFEEDGLSTTDRLGLLLLLVCLATASFIPMIHFAAAAFRRRLGTDGRNILLEFENGRRTNVDPSRLAWNDRAVFFDGKTFPLRSGTRHALYAPEELQKWLAPLLIDAKRMTEWETLRYQFKNRDRLVIAALGAVLLLFTILLLVKTFSVN
ncbi:MAG: hypothetical protein KJO70_00540 [Gammaproteobacteria bacterium]|nr:hypothetical protein [Gammaproteobacteria bacterium]